MDRSGLDSPFLQSLSALSIWGSVSAGDHAFPFDSKGVFEMITMTTAIFLIVRALNWYPQSETGYVLTVFVLLGLPNFVLKILPLFAMTPTDEWRESKWCSISYRVWGGRGTARSRVYCFNWNPSSQ